MQLSPTSTYYAIGGYEMKRVIRVRQDTTNRRLALIVSKKQSQDLKSLTKAEKVKLRTIVPMFWLKLNRRGRQPSRP